MERNSVQILINFLPLISSDIVSTYVWIYFVFYSELYVYLHL